MKSKFLHFLLLFFIIFFVLQLLGVGQKQEIKEEDIVLTMSETITIHKPVKLHIRNNTNESINLNSDCPGEPLDIFQYHNGKWEQKTANAENIECSALTLETGSEVELSYFKWGESIFRNPGKYKIELPITINNEEKKFFTEFEIVEPGFFKNIWNNLFYKPIYNTLIFFISVLPTFSNLGFSIIILTLLIKLVLLIPNNKAIKAQKDLQKVQPLLQEIQKKYKGDQKKIAEETMKIWKEHRVNPFGSCLPILIQFPIMIALFYVIKDGLNIDTNMYLLYDSLKNIEKIIDPLFINLLDLTKRNLYVLPIFVGGLQFFQMKLSLANKKKNTKKKKTSEMNQAEIMSSTMTYILPIMIAFFTANLPAAVGLYWGTSTLFGIGQQYMLNKKYN